jgi:1-deoxy-D-xylulose-5-phosphate reductoisomerase
LPRSLSILGSTGSIGVNTLDVVSHLDTDNTFEIIALTGASNIELLAAQAIRHRARIAVTADEARYFELRDRLSGSGIEAAAGRQAVIDAAAIACDITMAAIVGIAGLEPTLSALANGGTIALANKECLVAGGTFFMDEVARHRATLLPVDSEHSAIFQVLEHHNRAAVDRIILTASGGPFRTASRDDMRAVTVETARAHPNWSMGLKISIDSASMFNKALEMIEARHLFDLRPDQIEVIVHPQSIIHSMVGYHDGSVLAQLGASDMRSAIGFALNHPRRPPLPVERLDFARLARLDFEAPDDTRFPALRLAREVMAAGGLAGALFNGAREAALDAFISGRIGFLDMAEAVERTMTETSTPPSQTHGIAEIVAADLSARQHVGRLLSIN